MRASLEIVLGILDQEPPCLTQDDWDAPHGAILRLFANLGFIPSEPVSNPGATCPYCEDGAPYRLGDRLLCHRCHSLLDAGRMLRWQLDREAFLRWLAGQLGLQGGIRCIEERLWQLGAWKSSTGLYECFYRRFGPLTEAGRSRILTYRQALVLCAGRLLDAADGVPRPHLSLAELLQVGETLVLADPLPLLRPRGQVRFATSSGTLWAGDRVLGEVPLESKEYHFLDRLARELDHFVPYQDLKHHVLQASGSSDATEEATFCQNLKSRIKKKWIAEIGGLITTTNKGDGYRLRGYTGG